jgi:hypothetical protein
LADLGRWCSLAEPKGADQRQNRDDEHHGAAPFMPERLVCRIGTGTV